MGGHVFVDESKSRGYLLVASVVLPGELGTSRRAIRDLMLPGQKRLHMKSEGMAQRKRILAALAELGLTATIYRAGGEYKTDLARREACLARLVVDILQSGHTFLCLESDETLDARDRRQLAALIRPDGTTAALRYRHERAAQEPLLAVPDAIGWAWARGGDWRRRARALVNGVVDV